MKMTLTSAAQRFIRRLLRFDGGPGAGFRLSVTPGGCFGLAAEFSVEKAAKPGDAVFEIDGITLFLPAESRLLLDQVTVDFADTPPQYGFVFHDPKQSTSTCATAAPSPSLVKISEAAH